MIDWMSEHMAEPFSQATLAELAGRLTLHPLVPLQPPTIVDGRLIRIVGDGIRLTITFADQMR